MWQPRIMYLARWPQYYFQGMEEGKEMDGMKRCVKEGRTGGRGFMLVIAIQHVEVTR